MPQCNEFKKLIHKLIDDEISPSEKRELRSHIEKCDECNTYLKRAKKIQKMFSQLPKIKASNDFYVLLRARIRRETNNKRNNLYVPFNLPKPVFQFGFIIAVIFITILIINPLHLIRNDNKDQVLTSEERNDQFNGQVQYVIDGYPNSVSLSRDDTIDSLIIQNDSLNQIRKNKLIGTHVTPVNF
ncbi:MAG: zf-HC2 domain-containing protein [bacterium]